MEINADFGERVLLHSDDMAWQPSPVEGVKRRPLDRIGDEVARATSIVQFDQLSRFSAHTHGGGEEFIVLEGVFQDEHGDYIAGTYVRNPPTSHHTPASEPGCTLFVKLWQMQPDDRTHVKVHLGEATGRKDPTRPGVVVADLHSDDVETVTVERWAPGAEVRHEASDGIELLVLDGSGTESDEALRPRSWLRLPPGRPLNAKAGDSGTLVWMKTGHLGNIRTPE